MVFLITESTANPAPKWTWPDGLGLLIPAYEAAHCLGKTLDGVLAYAPESVILVVDDGSSDATTQIARSRGVAVQRQESNQGKGAALAVGLMQLHSKGFAWAITMDADGQHLPEDLLGFISVQPKDKVAMLVGQRRIGGSAMPWHRRFSNRTTTHLVSLLAGQDVFDAQSGFRMYRTALMHEGIWPLQGRFEWEAQALILCRRAGWQIQAVSISTVYGDAGSHMRLVVDTLRFLKMIARLAWTR
jgi:glycosyltransferase involved in cell wall biosynthesis